MLACVIHCATKARTGGCKFHPSNRRFDSVAAGLIAALRAGLPAAALAARRDLWHNAWSFAAIVLLLGAEWGFRRRWGLR